MAKTSISIGDKVAYSRAFLRSTGQCTGPIPFARGIVTEIKTCGSMQLATIDWRDPQIPERVNVHNLAKVGSECLN